MKKLIFGCGYLGRRVAARWLAAGDELFAVTRSQENAARLAADGIQPCLADVTDRSTLRDLPTVDTVLFAVGFDRGGGKAIHEVYVDGLAAALDALQNRPARWIYVSSTGVYGHATGDWVDETTDCHPVREGGRACLAAEQLLAAHRSGERAVVLRLAGIYGPGRIPLRQPLQAGEPIAAPSEGFLNLIHVEDAAMVVERAEHYSPTPQTWVVSDGHPVLRADYYGEMARLLGAPPPRFVDPPAGTPAAQRAGSDKRVANARLLRDLAPPFRYPSYREGLAAIIEAERRNA